MLDRETGTLRFAAGRIELSPALTRSAFLASRTGKAASFSVRNEPYCSWRLPEVSDPPRRFTVVVYFDDERLFQVHLVDSRPEFGGGWDDWSDVKERARKRSHDAWLKAEIGARRRFSWGSAESTLDPKSGDAGIVVSYRRAPGKKVPKRAAKATRG